MYSQLIRAVQQRVTFSHIQTLIDEYIKQDGNEIFLEKYQQSIAGKQFQADSHAKVIQYLEKKGFAFDKHHPMRQLEFDGSFFEDRKQHRFFELDDSKTIHIASSGDMVASGTTGLFLWEGSVAFLALLQQDASFKIHFNGKKVLELGCGAGLAGIAVALLAQPSQVLLTDVELVLDSSTIDNVKLNNCSEAECKVLDWTDNEALHELSTEYDVIIGCDLVYDPEIVQYLLGALKSLLHSSIKEAFLLCTLRNPSTYQTFVDEAAKFCQVSVSEVSIAPQNPVCILNPASLRLIHLSK